MSQKGKNTWLKLQLGGILVFFIVFFIWANTRCNSLRQEYKERYEARLAQQDSLEKMKASQEAAEDSLLNLSSGSSIADDSPIFPKSVLYVSIEGLKLRKDPGLKSEVLTELKLFEQVTFLHEVSDSTIELNLGKAMAEGHWVKVRSVKGHEGWVYEPGVYFYRRKHPDAY
jgi:hypothetical protein